MKHFFLLSILLLGSGAWAQTRPEVLAYAIPADAVRYERPRARRDEFEATYYLPGLGQAPRIGIPPVGIVEPEQPGDLVAVERFAPRTKVLTERRLYKDGLSFGVWRTWHPNGQLASEEPYFQDRKDGLFRHWDEEGKLVGQYQLTMGEGHVLIYNSQGRVVHDEQISFDPNVRALSMKRYTFDEIALRWLRKRKPDGLSFSFYGDDSLEHIASWVYLPNRDVISHGPFIKFDEKGAVTMKLWAIMGDDVDEKAYAAAAAEDPTLPPYFADANQYKTMVTPEAKALLKHYREMPPVKIPLEFDANGQPLLAPSLPDKEQAP